MDPFRQLDVLQGFIALGVLVFGAGFAVLLGLLGPDGNVALLAVGVVCVGLLSSGAIAAAVYVHKLLTEPV